MKELRANSAAQTGGKHFLTAQYPQTDTREIAENVGLFINSELAVNDTCVNEHTDPSPLFALFAPKQ